MSRSTRGRSVMEMKVRLAGSPAAILIDRARWQMHRSFGRQRAELAELNMEGPRLRLVLSALITADSHCLDGGCHVGSVLAQMVALAPAGRHIAVEPVEAKAAALAKRYTTVNVVHAALGENPGSMEMVQDLTGFASLRPASTDADAARSTRAVSVVTIDDLVGDNQLDVIKLDIEGAELWALRGATKVFAREQPSLLFECGTNADLERFGYARADIHSFITDELGYSIYTLTDFIYGREPRTAAEFERNGTYPFTGFNYVALPAQRPVARMVAENGRERHFS